MSRVALILCALAATTTALPHKKAVVKAAEELPTEALKPKLRRLDDHEDHDHDEHEDHDDEDDECFSADDTVELEGGMLKRLADLSVGDRVLSADRAGVLSYSEVVFKPHGAGGKPTSFLEIATDSGKALKATPSHLLQRCDGSLAYTKDLRTGDCLATKDGEEAVRSVAPAASKALPYSAVTLNEYLVVGGVVASPFAVNHAAVNMYYAVHRALYRMGFGSALASSKAMSANAMVGSTAIFAVNSYTGLTKKYLEYAGLKFQ
mmetsp:Transcript_16411/g.38016  ORF Transcript_16411/g.38016 Transcript_16411/m.38016 type:complete len:263 (-) Transcript_16411:315-1103(-)|eukprot:CAMPEP_0172581386 /NCGR_PEP_ID=MMETSP1068-20121228/618_1 /TAXON_ID=35684 /ORGANISM="Pseudopedinella elastica, Strain CCMP716" /LENGTH=262 /DNA_ID=CAMNT_0013374345 /DNA_START=64 /DNA_END=852 /DNA_ORIENTATION=-